MPRIIVEKDYTLRRNEILDAALRLVYTKGYEQMTIQDILLELGISKGAFYHYFDSKGALLEALIERMIDEASLLLQPILDDPTLSGLEKLERYFVSAGRWKIEQKDFLVPLLRVWYTDNNAIVRQKVNAAGLQRIGPLITGVIHQGIREGVFSASHSTQVGEVALSMMFSLGEITGQVLLSDAPRAAMIQRLQDALAAYTDALERVLGVSSGSLCFIEPEVLIEWVDAVQPRKEFVP